MAESEVPSAFSDAAQFILHPTDFSPQSELAFAHALRVALTNDGRLSLLHVGENAELDWDHFPSVRETLQRWGLLEPGAQHSDVKKLGIGIEKVVFEEKNIVDAITGFVMERQVDLLVLATEGRRGLAAWLKPSTAERAARMIAVPTLFVPGGSHGCVSLEDGRVTMDQVLVPVDHQPASRASIQRGLRAIQAYGHQQSKLTLLHVGSEDNFPDVQTPSGPWQVERATRQGNPVTEILAAADEMTANLLIMVTAGTNGILDVLRGTTTEQVLRRSPCPVLAVPAEF